MKNIEQIAKSFEAECFEKKIDFAVFYNAEMHTMHGGAYLNVENSVIIIQSLIQNFTSEQLYYIKELFELNIQLKDQEEKSTLLK